MTKFAVSYDFGHINWRNLSEKFKFLVQFHFIRNLLDDIINNALRNLKKSPDAIKMTMCHISEMPIIFQQFTSDYILIQIPNDIWIICHNPGTWHDFPKWNSPVKNDAREQTPKQNTN